MRNRLSYDDRLPHRTARSSSPNFTWTNLLVAFIPALGLIQFNLIGQLYLHEIIILAIFIVTIFSAIPRSRWSAMLPVLVFMIAWLISQIITDVVRNTELSDLARGWAKILLLIIAFLTLCRIINTPKRALIWVVATIIPTLVRPFQLYDGTLDFLNLWKFGVGPALLLTTCTPFIIAIHKDPNRRIPFTLIGMLHIAFGIASFFLNARSFAGMAIITGLAVLGYSRFRGVKLSRTSLFKLVLIASTLIYALAFIYTQSADSGFFGVEAQQKYRAQALRGSSPIMVILAGRSESLVSTIAIADSPIIGHGSWAKDIKYLFALHEIRQELSDSAEIRQLDSNSTEGLIPSHSYLLGAWVESGVVGGAFWFFILIWTMTKVLPIAWRRGDAIGLYCIMAITPLAWNILFSPFGAHVRMETAGIFAIFVLAISTQTSKRQ